MNNIFTEILNNAQAERVRRQAQRREEWTRYQSTMPKPKAPEAERPQPIEYREYLRRKVKELLSD